MAVNVDTTQFGLGFSKWNAFLFRKKIIQDTWLEENLGINCIMSLWIRDMPM